MVDCKNIIMNYLAIITKIRLFKIKFSIIMLLKLPKLGHSIIVNIWGDHAVGQTNYIPREGKQIFDPESERIE